MISFLLAIVVVALAANLIVFLLCWRRIRGVYLDLSAFFVATRDGEPSGFAATVAAVSRTMAIAITDQLKTSLMGAESAKSRQISLLESDSVKDQLESRSPLIAGLMGLSPRLANRLAKNPGLLESLAGIIGHAGGGNHQSTGSSGSAPKFHL